jgi:hypothetical protein
MLDSLAAGKERMRCLERTGTRQARMVEAKAPAGTGSTDPEGAQGSRSPHSDQPRPRQPSTDNQQPISTK